MLDASGARQHAPEGLAKDRDHHVPSSSVADSWTVRQAQTATVINLSCDGTIRHDTADTREQVAKLGLVVNLVDQTVIGFGTVGRIYQVDASSIAFDGEGPIVYRGINAGTLSISGMIDRVTGTASATTIQMSADATKKIVTTTTYDL